jgi:hypothetical protein
MTALLISCQETLEERGAREARDYTKKHCPAPVAQYVTMDSMLFDKESHSFGYYYTLSGPLDDSTYINRNNPREVLLLQVKNSTNLKIYKDADYNFRYVYHSTKLKGVTLFDETFGPKDYK